MHAAFRDDRDVAKPLIGLPRLWRKPSLRPRFTVTPAGEALCYPVQHAITNGRTIHCGGGSEENPCGARRPPPLLPCLFAPPSLFRGPLLVFLPAPGRSFFPPSLPFPPPRGGRFCGG